MAAPFLDWLAIPAGQSWLDLGCGTGALSQMILEVGAPARVVAVDPTVGFLEHARRVIVDARIGFCAGTANALPAKARSIDVLVSGLMLNFLPHLSVALDEMRRVLRPGGAMAAYVWDYAGEMEMLRYFWDVAVELDPGAHALDEGERFPVCQPDALAREFGRAGLQRVEVRALAARSIFADFDDYWLPFLGGQGPAPGYVTGLRREGREKLESRLRARLPVRLDGSIELTLRAWAVRGFR